MDLTSRRRQTTRLEIEAAAIDLFERQGYDAVTVEQIAATAGIATRTYYRYCAAKEDALTSHLWVGARDLDLNVARHQGLPFLAAAREGFLETVLQDGVPAEQLRRMIALCVREPPLRARWLDAGREAESRLAASLARERPSLRGAPAAVLAGAVVGALTTALEMWAAHPGPLPDHVDRCLDVLAPLFAAAGPAG